MTSNILITVLTAVLTFVLGFVVGRRRKEVPAETLAELARLKAAGEAQANMLLAHEQRLAETRQQHEAQMQEQREQTERRLAEHDAAFERRQTEQRESYERQLETQRQGYEDQLAALRANNDKQIAGIKEMNRTQLESQLQLIREQIQTTSEKVLKARQEELGAVNVEQVSKIVDPLQTSLKLMREALDDSKTKHQEALHKLDATIQANMKNSADLGATAERLTRALTGEVKVQGNFGELKLKQLLEDLGLKDGEQYSSQAHLRDSLGHLIKDDDGRGLIPDFILHFPNKRDVIVDSKMSFTDYERYVNAATPEEQTAYLHAHIESVRRQVDRLARKDYSRYLQEGYNKLNFVIMYIHTEGALNLALLNDSALWREAYDKGVLILGPQTMYMNLRILELMWTQVRQLQNQESMMDAANKIIERTQNFAQRFAEVQRKMSETTKSMEQLRITTADSGQSIITAARNLLKAGARENKGKKSLEESERSVFLDADTTLLMQSNDE